MEAECVNTPENNMRINKLGTEKAFFREEYQANKYRITIEKNTPQEIIQDHLWMLSHY